MAQTTSTSASHGRPYHNSDSARAMRGTREAHACPERSSTAQHRKAQTAEQRGRGMALVAHQNDDDGAEAAEAADGADDDGADDDGAAAEQQGSWTELESE